MGGESTSCNNETKKVLIECAFFKPDSIIGRSLKYDLNSEAAYKFERELILSCLKILFEDSFQLLKIIQK